MDENDSISAGRAECAPEAAAVTPAPRKPPDLGAVTNLPKPDAPIIQRGSYREMTAFDPDDPRLRRPPFLHLEDSGRAQAGRYTFDLHPHPGVMIDHAGPPEDE